MPIAYNGRASSIVVSGTQIRRPKGQVKDEKELKGRWSETKKLDFEVEIAAIIGQDSDHGKPIKLKDAMNHVFGFVILNDWSARDI